MLPLKFLSRIHKLNAMLFTLLYKKGGESWMNAVRFEFLTLPVTLQLISWNSPVQDVK